MVEGSRPTNNSRMVDGFDCFALLLVSAVTFQLKKNHRAAGQPGSATVEWLMELMFYYLAVLSFSCYNSAEKECNWAAGQPGSATKGWSMEFKSELGHCQGVGALEGTELNVLASLFSCWPPSRLLQLSQRRRTTGDRKSAEQAFAATAEAALAAWSGDRISESSWMFKLPCCSRYLPPWLLKLSQGRR